MKYILMTVAALTVAFGLGFLVTGLIRRKIKRKPPMWAHILIAICISLLVICVGSFGYLSIHYPAQDEAIAVFSDQNDAQTFEIEGGYFVDGRGEDTALVFYQGAKVDAEAYLPLMKRLAENGVDCFLLKTPFDMPIFDSTPPIKSSVSTTMIRSCSAVIRWAVWSRRAMPLSILTRLTALCC